MRADHLLALNVHHIVSDGWSLAVMFREAAPLMPHFAPGRPTPLEPLPIQYADFAAWQRTWLAGERLNHQLAFCTCQLSGAPAVLELRTHYPRPAVHRFRVEHRGRISRADRRGPASRTPREGVTPFMLLLAVFSIPAVRPHLARRTSLWVRPSPGARASRPKA